MKVLFKISGEEIQKIFLRILGQRFHQHFYPFYAREEVKTTRTAMQRQVSVSDTAGRKRKISIGRRKFSASTS